MTEKTLPAWVGQLTKHWWGPSRYVLWDELAAACPAPPTDEASVARIARLIQRWHQDAAKVPRGTDYDTGQYDALVVCISELRAALIQDVPYHLTAKDWCPACGRNYGKDHKKSTT